MSACRSTLPLLDPFIDGELPADKLLEVEQHLAVCEVCSERIRLAVAVRASTRRAVRGATVVSPAFEERVRSALAAERQREREAHARPDEGGKVLSWRVIAPVAAAAALTLLWAASVNDSPARSSHAASASVEASPSIAKPVEALLDDIVSNHVRSTTPEVTEKALVSHFEPQVGVPVRLPRLAQYGARWEGGSVVPVRNHRAASFRYSVHGHRVTVYVYDATRVPLRTRLEARVVGDTPVFVGQRRGYSIAAVERSGVGHALTTDMTDDESAELIVASVH